MSPLQIRRIYFLADNTTRCITGSGDNTAKLWEVQTGKCLFTWTEDTAVKRVQFSEDNKMVLFVTEQRMGFSGGIKIYPVSESLGSERNEFFPCHLTLFSESAEPIAIINNPTDVTKKFTVAAWTAFDKNLVVGHLDGSVSLIDWKVRVLALSFSHRVERGGFK